MLLTTLMLVAGLPTTPEPQVQPQTGWVVELRGDTMHSEAKPKAPLIVDFQWPQPKPEPNVDPVETQYYDDLLAVFGTLKIDVIEAQYHDDLRPVFENLKKHNP